MRSPNRSIERSASLPVRCDGGGRLPGAHTQSAGVGATRMARRSRRRSMTRRARSRKRLAKEGASALRDLLRCKGPDPRPSAWAMVAPLGRTMAALDLGGESERATAIYPGRVVRERRRQPTPPGISDGAPAERGNESRLHRPEGDNVDGDYFRRVCAGARCGVRGSRRGGSSRARLSARAACRRRRSAKFLAMVMQEFHGDQRRRPSQRLARRSAFRWRRPKPEFRGAVSKGGGVSGMLKRPGSRTVPWKIGSMRGPPPEKGWFDALNQEQSRGGAAAGSRRGTSGEGR